MKIAFSWDDGALEDRRLFELHEKYEIPGMFFVPTRNREGRAVLSPELIRKSESDYVAFGGHTENHTYLTNISLKDAESEIRNNKYYLEDILGHEVNDFCFPGGLYTKEILKLACHYYQTVRTADTMNFKCDSFVLKPSIHFYPRGKKSIIYNAIKHNSLQEIFYLITHFRKSYFNLVKGLVACDNDHQDKTFVVWGHSWELQQCRLWTELESLMKYVSKLNCCKYKDLFDKSK